VGDSVTPLKFLGVSVVLNIGLDVLFLLPLGMGVKGAALATVLSQYVSGLGLALYTWRTVPHLRVGKEDRVWEGYSLRSILNLSLFTCLQQSVMNGGILMVQGLVNSFGTTVMAAFAVAVKIDSLCYMPIQDFGNAFSTFVAQNYGAGKRDRIQKGILRAVLCSVSFCLVMGGLVCLLAPRLMALFVGVEAAEVIAVGVGYLRIEGTLYLGLGILFLLYGYFRGVDRPAVSVVLTVCSLGTRVALAYALSSVLGVTIIWAAIPIGWFFADAVGMFLLRRDRKATISV
jgi:putative MATE family efflux protein